MNRNKIKDLKPDKPLTPKRHDTPLIFELSTNNYLLKLGLNSFECLYEDEFEES